MASKDEINNAIKRQLETQNEPFLKGEFERLLSAYKVEIERNSNQSEKMFRKGILVGWLSLALQNLSLENYLDFRARFEELKKIDDEIGGV